MKKVSNIPQKEAHHQDMRGIQSENLHVSTRPIFNVRGAEYRDYHRYDPTITYYWTALLILNLTNSKIAETEA
jgi:hypothetical protein